ncbi:MAG: 2-oxoglutarate and iron-dependent oxygenase domain-containing protein [Steroidobacteraceae bacterium]
MPALPLLDLREFDHETTRAGFVEALRRAAHETGFFYLTGHGVSAALADELLTLSREFFALPLAEKQAIDIALSPHFRGYTRVGSERTGGRIDWREQIDLGLEAEPLRLQPDDPSWKRLQGPNQWPRRPAGLRSAVLGWHETLQPVAAKLLRAFALSLGQPADAFDDCWQGLPNQVIKTIHYPPGSGESQGCGAHKDSEFLTLLLQDDVGGLEVQIDGEWRAAPPLPGTFVVNTGELLELASNGYYCATLHRVVTPPPGVSRQSLAFFFAARLDAVVPCLPLPPALRAAARGVSREPSNPLFHEVAANTLKGRLRSHPETAARFYADLVR